MYYYLTTESTFKSRISYNKLKINARAYPSLYIDSTKIKEEDISIMFYMFYIIVFYYLYE